MPIPIDDALAEVLRRNVDFLDDLARVEAHLANRGVLLESRALVQEAIQLEQAFREARGVVRIRMYYVNIIDGDGGVGHHRKQGGPQCKEE